MNPLKEHSDTVKNFLHLWYDEQNLSPSDPITCCILWLKEPVVLTS